MTGNGGDRPAEPAELDVLALRERLVAPNGPYAALDVVASTGSTNADLLAAAGAGAADRTVLLAERQTAGRGRRDRSWVSPAGTGVYLSVLLRPAAVPPARLGTLALVAGLALVHVADQVAGVAGAALKWPNDLLVNGTKVAGVLAEATTDGATQAVVVGVGINVASPGADVPAGPGALPAGSLADQGAGVTNRTRIAAGFLLAFAELETGWRRAEGDVGRSGVLAGYRAACGSIGQRVRVELSDSSARVGRAVDVDAEGHLLVELGDGTVWPVSAADVVHLRNDP